jgi:hypothetical protein
MHLFSCQPSSEDVIMSLIHLMRTFALALCAIILASCVVEVEDVQPQRPGICTREYSPVCATRGNREKTFGNACEARRSGWNIIGRGECRGIIIEPPRPEPILCPQIYQPVCAIRNGRERTFGNSCEADASGWRTVSRGECGRDDVIIEQPAICPKIYQPVCATRGRQERTFENSCLAESEGWRPVDNGACGREMIR